MRKLVVKFVFAAVLLSVMSGISFGAVLIKADPSQGVPELSFNGYQWLRYTAGYDNQKFIKSAFSVERTYITTKVKADDYEAELTLDMPNTQYGQVVNAAAVPAQGAVDWASWVKSAFVDFKTLPLLKEADIRIRLGVQKSYFGTIDTWSYQLIDKAMEDTLKVADSANQGIALIGTIPFGFGDYQVAMYNGNGYKKIEDNLGKMLMGSINVVPLVGISVRGSYAVNNIGENRWTDGAPDTKLYQQTSRGAVVISLASGPIESYFEGLEQQTKKATGKSGILQGFSGYLGVKIMDPLQICLRFDTINPDTEVERDEYNVYYAGVNYKIQEKVLLQVNYQLTQEKASNYQAKAVTNNLLMTQVKWEY